MSASAKSYKGRRRPVRSKQVLVILNSRIETVELIREEVYPPIGDFAEDPPEVAVVRWHGLEVSVPLESVVFLGELPPESKWIREARAKVDAELISTFRQSVKTAIRTNRNENHAARRIARKHKRRTKQK